MTREDWIDLFFIVSVAFILAACVALTGCGGVTIPDPCVLRPALCAPPPIETPGPTDPLPPPPAPVEPPPVFEPPPPPVEPTPPPPPVVEGTVHWTPSTDADLCPLAHVAGTDTNNLSTPSSSAPPPVFLADVEAITLAHPPRPGDDARSWYSRLVVPFAVRGLSIALYGEELAVARVSGVSENYDRLLNSGQPRTGIGTFRSRCFPATSSEELTPSADTDSGTVVQYPARVTEVRIKVHTPAKKRADGLTLMDGVALATGVNPAFPTRPSWPACGPEGETEEERAARVQCDRAMDVRWSSTKGGHAHQSNPWLYHAKPGGLVTACVGAVCSKPVKAQ